MYKKDGTRQSKYCEEGWRISRWEIVYLRYLVSAATGCKTWCFLISEYFPNSITDYFLSA